MKKKLILIIIGILIIFIVLLLILFIKNNINKNVKENKYKLSEPILEKIDNKNNFILFITDNENECSSCNDINKLLKYYKNVYNLNVITFDKSETSEGDFNNLIKDFGLQDGFLVSGDILLVKDGVVVSAIKDAVFEDIIKENLINNGFINDVGMDYFIEDEEFNKLYSSNNKELVLAYSGNEEGYNYREILFELATKYNFKYSTIRIGFGDTLNTSDILSKKMNNNYKLPLLMIVGNNEIIDYTTSSRIEEFLKENKFI